jgi:4-amino-4-deoxy-L-arabinose transferase-like glycosyltransferase
MYMDEKGKYWVGAAMMGLVLVLASVTTLWGLGKEPLQDYDEATYAEVVHEALVSGDFISFTFGGADFFKKPPLYFWMMGLSESVLGETPFAMRLPSALSFIALIAVMMALVYTATGNAYAAAFAGAALIATGPLLETAREVRLDITVVLFIMLSLYSLVRGLSDRRWLVLFGVSLGLAVLAKSVIAIFAFIAAGALLIVLRRLDILRDKQFWWGILAGAVVVVPWHLVETLRHGMPFWQEYVGFEVIARTQENLFWTVHITNADLLWYLGNFAKPWYQVFFAALLCFALLRKRLEALPRALVFASLGTLASMALVFFLSATKAPTYLVPLYPFALLVVVLAAMPLFHSPVKYAAGAVAAALLVWGGWLSIYNAYHYNPYFFQSRTVAYDEREIGTVLGKAIPEGTRWYVYGTPSLGSIMYYSQRLYTYALTDGAKVPEGSVVVLTTGELAHFEEAFPMLETNGLYHGKEVSLLEVRRANDKLRK